MASRMSGLSPAIPIAVLHLVHMNPLTAPVTWLWSTQGPATVYGLSHIGQNSPPTRTTYSRGKSCDLFLGLCEAFHDLFFFKIVSLFFR